MGEASTLLCIHQDPAQFAVFEQDGYELVTATSGRDGLRLFMSRSVDAILLEYQLCLSDGRAVAAEMKRVDPQVPIVMLADQPELPEEALQFVNAVVAKSDGTHFLLATVRSLLRLKPSRRNERKTTSAEEEQDAPFSAGVWQNIRNGTLQF